MSTFYRSERIGKNGKPFFMIKFRTLKHGSDNNLFADRNSYTRFGRFLRKYKIDELPQLWNVLKGQMSLVGPRPEEKRTVDIIPEEIRKIILSVKPGMTSLSSLHFFDEERLLQQMNDPSQVYWQTIKPMKFVLDVFYVQNKSFLLDIAILWSTLKKVIKA